MSQDNVVPIKPTAASVKAEAAAQVAKEQAGEAKAKLVTKYRAIAAAEKVLANLRAEALVLERDIQEELGG